MILHSEIGRIDLVTLALPQFVKVPTAVYTSTGSVFVDYRREEDQPLTDYHRFAVMNDDGSGFREIFAGVIPQKKKANGIRFMPYSDGRRILLGDYVLECSPDIDHCTEAQIVPIQYPWDLENNPGIFCHWSEIIISPDNEHICWTYLTYGGAGAAIGKLRRGEDCYLIEDAKLIHSTKSFEPDPDRPGFIRLLPSRGGEVKQFVHGGSAISLVGSANGTCIADSVVQDLESGTVTPVTRNPGYDETTLFSPDEKLGITMTTRFSAKTNFDVLGILPRPYSGIVIQPLIQTIYLIGVTEVRLFRGGNVGPALIDLARSASDPGYKGTDLHDPEEKWVYNSPMSWSPDSRNVMWRENFRGSSEARIRVARLSDYQPSEAVRTVPTPDAIPYGMDAGHLFPLPEDVVSSGRIAGKQAGEARFSIDNGQDDTRGAMFGPHFSRELVYDDFSDDGVHFLDGSEKIQMNEKGETIYTADLRRTAGASREKEGFMKLRLTFSRTSLDGSSLPSLLFDPDEDGNPRSFGTAEFGGRTIRVEDLQ